jgi:hypothetical protein
MASWRVFWCILIIHASRFCGAGIAGQMLQRMSDLPVGVMVKQC